MIVRYALCGWWTGLSLGYTREWCIAALGLLMLLMAGGPASAISIRHDRSDSQYTNLANNEHPYGGMVLGNGWVGSATLISPNWILTASHVLESNTTFYTTAGSRSIVQRVPYPDGSYDIGLARLDSPITTIDPVKLYSLNFGLEDDQDAIIIGAGNMGTGLTGQQAGTSGTRRAAETYVYANASEWGWSSHHLLTWFRAPGNGAAYLEGGSTQGDSGGGLLLNVDGEYAIAGVNSQSWSGGSGGDTYGKYDTGGVFVRSAPLNNWILSIATDAQVIEEAIPPLEGDINGDGFVGIEDLNIVLGHWNVGTPPSVGTPTIPEPASLSLLGLGSMALLRRSRHGCTYEYFLWKGTR
jgi:Trypsin/PEP-CTERM motif